jgi:hypothetical protein
MADGSLRAHQPDELFDAVADRFDPERPYPGLRSISRAQVAEEWRLERQRVKKQEQRRRVRANRSDEQP